MDQFARIVRPGIEDHATHCGDQRRAVFFDDRHRLGRLTGAPPHPQTQGCQGRLKPARAVLINKYGQTSPLFPVIQYGQTSPLFKGTVKAIDALTEWMTETLKGCPAPMKMEDFIERNIMQLPSVIDAFGARFSDLIVEGGSHYVIRLFLATIAENFCETFTDE